VELEKSHKRILRKHNDAGWRVYTTTRASSY